MKLEEIKAAVDAGKVVCWNNDNYTVEKNYVVVCNDNNVAVFILNEENATCGEFFILENL